MTTPIPSGSLQKLLVYAARCVQAALCDQPQPPAPADASLGGIGGGVFVTLHCEGRLAGCIGYVEAPPPLIDTVRRAACAAALDDVRFTRLLPAHLVHVEVEVSILSPPRRMEPSELQAGVHGGILRWQGRQGLLLPQVAREHGLDRAGFLAALCEKSGVPPDTFLREDCELRGFTVQLVGGRLPDLVAQSDA